MTTTLIVRDATLAINGAPEKRGEHRAHIESRLTEVATMDPRTAEECVEVLCSVARGEGADPDVLEALVIVAVAQPELAQRINLPPVPLGRRLATRLERLAENERAMAVLEMLKERFPGQDALERDLGQLMRRQGTVQDLVERYFERARKLMREGRNNEAAGWLREVLQLDPGRKDAARMIRDLRIKRRRGKRRSFGPTLRLLAVTLALAAGASYGVERELRLHQEFETLPQVIDGNVNSTRRRLGELERFIAKHPVWHGALGALSERSELRVQIAVFEDRDRQAGLEAAEVVRERLESAELSREAGLGKVQSGDIAGALTDLRRALEFGGSDWSRREEVARDVAQLEAHLKGPR